MRSVIALFIPIALAGCTERGIDCTREARASVQVTVVDPDGNAVVEPTVTWGLAMEENDCEQMPGDVWVCGWEQEGTLRITADAQGFQPATQEVLVQADVCHVRTEQLTLTLEPVDCPDIELPSVRVTVTDIALEAIDGAWADIDDPNTDGPNVPCDATADPKVFDCYGHPAGTYNVLAGAPGYVEDRSQVQVTEDDCGVVTTEQSFMLRKE